MQSSYYTWVDQFDTFGLGKNVPIATGNMSDSLEALVDGKFVTLRVPYPMGFHAKGMDGRIDDPNAGWKGRGIWSTYAGRAPFHIEGGKGTTSKVVKFQLRPDPLAFSSPGVRALHPSLAKKAGGPRAFFGGTRRVGLLAGSIGPTADVGSKAPRLL